MDALIPDEFLSEPTVGVVQKDFRTPRERLFGDILVPISGDEVSFSGLDQAIVIAKREYSRLYGLHVVPSQAEKEGEAARAIKADFEQRCAEEGVHGNLVLVVGEVSHTICDRARWTDLVTLNISFPPPPQMLARLSSGVSTVIRRCPRPILAVPRKTTSLSRALLAFDGSPKSEEALYLACYLAENWNIPLVVVSVNERGYSAEEANQKAQNYLQERGVDAQMVLTDGPVVDAILRTAAERDSEVLVMGGYGRSRVPEIVLGSVVDEVLRSGSLPVLISR
jgi:nucleotide-binding universal stress UspA family protein